MADRASRMISVARDAKEAALVDWTWAWREELSRHWPRGAGTAAGEVVEACPGQRVEGPDEAAGKAGNPAGAPHDARSVPEKPARMPGRLPGALRGALVPAVVEGLFRDEVAAVQGRVVGSGDGWAFRARHFHRVRPLGGPATAAVSFATAGARASGASWGAAS